MGLSNIERGIRIAIDVSIHEDLGGPLLMLTGLREVVRLQIALATQAQAKWRTM